MSMPHECECRTCGHKLGPFFYQPAQSLATPSTPVVQRIEQWDWQGKLAADPVMCASDTEQGKPMNGGSCKHVARYYVDGAAMCVVHTKCELLRRFDPSPR